MPELPPPTVRIVTALQSSGIAPILYGSQGVSLYLGAFKRFGDIDLLIDDRWLHDDWQKLGDSMSALGFTLQDEREHEFTGTDNLQVAFAGTGILVRDGIVKSLDGAVETFAIGDSTILTLKPEVFKKAYEFSARDGYREHIRGKKDRKVVALLGAYLTQGSRRAS